MVDTSVLIDHLRGVRAALDLLEDALERGDGVAGSVLSRTELLAGMRSHEKRRTRDLIGGLQWIDVDQEIADEAGRLGRTYRSSHTGIDLTDYVIAATCMEWTAELWTRNVKHFPMMDGLEAPY